MITRYKQILIGFIFFCLAYCQDIGDQRNISPTITIRYDDILSGMNPSSTIGILLEIDDTRYTGFDTSSDGSELRILMGWKWSVVGLGTKTIEVLGNEETVNMYSFGAKYGILDGMYTAIEYVMIQDEELDGHTPTDDFIRLSVGVDF
tara:strand:+ start:101 stop:544 length:444 start_codon:yes stop_codon:yes gene_type:complete